MAKKILLTGFKGGTGVTTCAVGLGTALAQLGERTLIVDGDAKTGCALLIGECRHLIVYTLADYEKGACRAKQAIVSHPKNSNLMFMPSIGLNDISYAQKAVSDVDGLFDYILLDKTAEPLCDSAIIVSEPFTPSVKAADLCRSYLTDSGIKNVSLIVNKLNGGQILNGETMTAHEIAALLHMELTAVIPEDLLLSSGKWKPATLKAFKTAAEVLTGRREGVLNILSGWSGVNAYFKRKLRDKV